MNKTLIYNEITDHVMEEGKDFTLDNSGTPVFTKKAEAWLLAETTAPNPTAFCDGDVAIVIDPGAYAPRVATGFILKDGVWVRETMSNLKKMGYCEK